jgi:hypothetical protein
LAYLIFFGFTEKAAMAAGEAFVNRPSFSPKRLVHEPPLCKTFPGGMSLVGGRCGVLRGWFFFFESDCYRELNHEGQEEHEGKKRNGRLGFLRVLRVLRVLRGWPFPTSAADAASRTPRKSGSSHCGPGVRPRRASAGRPDRPGTTAPCPRREWPADCRR